MNGEPDARRTRTLLAAATVALAAVRWLGRARVPDDYDAVGFVRAVERFDLSALQPHFPGYPVYVAGAKLLHGLGLSPLAAATALSALASAATGLALWRLGSVAAGPLAEDREAEGRRRGARAGWTAFALWAAALLPMLLGGAAMADATATALMAGAFAALTWPGARATFAATALGALALGARISYWPLALSLAVLVWRERRAWDGPAVLGALVGLLAWALPFVYVAGAAKLWALGGTHVAGHFSTWGGSVVTRPDLGSRLLATARDVVYDGLFPEPLVLAAAVALVAWARPRPSRRAWWLAATVALPYLVWIFVAQNVLEQPRHALPLVAAATLALALATRSRPLAASLLVALAAAVAVPLTVMRVRVPPAPVQLAAWLAARAPGAEVYGTRSARLIDWAEPAVHAHPRGTLAEVDVGLERLDVLPPFVYVTSEVATDPIRVRRLEPLATFCRDPRLDRQAPCLSVSRYKARPPW